MFVDYDQITTSDTDESNASKPQNKIEVAVLDMVKAHAHFVNTRYGVKKIVGYPRLRYQPYYPKFVEIADQILQADRNPQDFISFHFEMWKNLGEQFKLEYCMNKEGERMDFRSMPGVAFPSLAYISKRDDLLQQFLHIDKYSPKKFLSEDQDTARWEKIVEEKARRECARLGMTEDEYWMDARVLLEEYDYFLLKHAKGFFERAELFKETWGEDIREFLGLKYDLENLRQRGAPNPNEETISPFVTVNLEVSNILVENQDA